MNEQQLRQTIKEEILKEITVQKAKTAAIGIASALKKHKFVRIVDDKLINRGYKILLISK